MHAFSVLLLFLLNWLGWYCSKYSLHRQLYSLDTNILCTHSTQLTVTVGITSSAAAVNDADKIPTL